MLGEGFRAFDLNIDPVVKRLEPERDPPPMALSRRKATRAVKNRTRR